MGRSNENKSTNAARMALAKEEYLNQNLVRKPGDPPFTLKSLAEHFKMSYAQLRDYAAKDGWNDELARRVEEQQAKLRDRMSQTSLFDELEIRTRQASYAKFASALAIKRLQKIQEGDIERLSLKDAIELLKLGLVAERAAADFVGPPPANDGPESGATLTDGQIFAVAKQIIDMSKDESGTYALEAPRVAKRRE